MTRNVDHIERTEPGEVVVGIDDSPSAAAALDMGGEVGALRWRPVAGRACSQRRHKFSPGLGHQFPGLGLCSRHPDP